MQVGVASQKACGCFSRQKQRAALEGGLWSPQASFWPACWRLQGGKAGRQRCWVSKPASREGSPVILAIATTSFLPWQSRGKGGREWRVPSSASSSFSSSQVVGQEAPGSSNKGSLKLRINLAKPKKEKEKLQKQRSGGVFPGNLATFPEPRRAGCDTSASG